MFLDKPTFSKVIASSPLVSIDLVVMNAEGEVLLGERLNRPAKGYWFVPGGRILKNETLVDAFKRLTCDELGMEFAIEQSVLLGPFDHFYDDYVFGDDVTTHYVAIAFILKLDRQLDNLPLDLQHGDYKWFSVPMLLADHKVHKHTKWYLDKNKTDLFTKD